MLQSDESSLARGQNCQQREDLYQHGCGISSTSVGRRSPAPAHQSEKSLGALESSYHSSILKLRSRKSIEVGLKQ